MAIAFEVGLRKIGQILISHIRYIGHHVMPDTSARALGSIRQSYASISARFLESLSNLKTTIIIAPCRTRLATIYPVQTQAAHLFLLGGVRGH